MRTVAALIFVILLSACSANNGVVCAGWTKSPPINNAVVMASSEPQVSRWIVAHNEYGSKSGCW